VASVHRGRILVLHEAGESSVILPGSFATEDMAAITVGDWVLIERDAARILETLAQSCRYRNCGHEGDEGCALQAAIEGGQIDARRIKSYLKLQREAANAARTLHDRRERERLTGRAFKAVQDHQRKEKQGR
jgi:hypothetical protein